MKLTYKVFLFGLFFPAFLFGQETGLLRFHPDHPAKESEAALWGGVEDGRFKPTHAALFQWSAGADAKVVRHGNTTSWTGALSFGQTTGKNMYSSMLLEPDYYPFDILEFSPGTKSRQDVSLQAGFLSDLGYEWAVGLDASVKGAFVSKRQEVPHSSFGLDAKVAPVVTYVMDDDMGLVSSYFGRLRTEALKAEEDGGLFLDEGMRYGTYQALGGNGVFPVREFSHGFSELFYSPEVSVGFDIAWKRGQAGGKDCERFRFPGSTISASFQHTVLADKADHAYGASYSRMRDQLRLVLESGPQAVSDRNHRHLELMYEARFIGGILKKTGITLDGNFWTEYSWLGGGDKNQRYDGTAVAHAAFSYGLFDLDLSVQGGNGWWKDPGKTGQESDCRPAQPSEDWLRKMDYYLTQRMGCGGTLTGHISSSLYVQLYAYWHRAFDTTLLGGKNREIVTLRVGYKF